MSDITTADSSSAPEQRRALAPVLFNPMTTAHPSSPSPAASVFAENHKPKDHEMKTQTTSPYAPGASMAEATDALNKQLANRKKLDEQINAMPATIAGTEQNIAKFESELGSKEGDLALADEGTAEHKTLRKAVADLTDQLSAEQQRLRSANIRIGGLEGKVPEVDLEVRLATQ